MKRNIYIFFKEHKLVISFVPQTFYLWLHSTRCYIFRNYLFVMPWVHWRSIFSSFSCSFRQNYAKQESIPVGCVPSAAVAVSPAIHTPYHACPPTCTPPAMYAPAMHTPKPHTPSAMHAPPCMHPAMHAPCHACPSPCTPYRVNRMTNRQEWKHYLSTTRRRSQPGPRGLGIHYWRILYLWP